MAYYVLSCKCGAQFSISTIDAGKTLTCDECHLEIVAPNLREIRELPLAREQNESVELTWDKGNGILFGLGSIFIALGLSLAFYHFFQAGQIDMTDHTEAAMLYGNAVIDQMPPLVAIQQWRLIRGIGLGEQQEDDFQARQKEYNSRQFYGFIELGIAGLGIALMVMAIFARRRINATDPR